MVARKRKKEVRPTTPTAVVLADIPERARLRELQSNLEAQRDKIAALDLEIEHLRQDLSAFEAHYRARLAQEHTDLLRVERMVRHLERWGELLQAAPRKAVQQRGRRLEQRRQRELQQQAEQRDVRAHQPVEPPSPKAAASSESIKSAYRTLARRYHPDLARTEEERLQFSEMMRHINELYRLRDTERLLVLAEQSKGAEIDTYELSLDDQTQLLEDRLQWFVAVIENLKDERLELERSATCELMRNIEQAEKLGRDLIEELRLELQHRVQSAYGDIKAAITALETEVRRYNRADGEKALPAARSQQMLANFDPFTDKGLVRLGLDQLATLQVSRTGQELAEWMQDIHEHHPGLLRLVLLTYVSELSPFPLPGLESYDDLALRYEHLAKNDKEPMSLELALVEADEIVEFGVRQASAKVAHTGLRFRSPAGGEAVLAALKSLPIRREFRRVLTVLGQLEQCAKCQKEDFSVPLFRLHGLDALRANVCPQCGHTLRSYWMPKGKDVQAVLNSAFLDFDIVSEWSFSLARTTIATQLVPVQVDTMSVGDLKQRIHLDVFERNEIELTRGQLEIWHDNRRLPERTPLLEVPVQQFALRFADGAKMNEAEAAEIIRHRIRNRFRA